MPRSSRQVGSNQHQERYQSPQSGQASRQDTSAIAAAVHADGPETEKPLGPGARKAAAMKAQRAQEREEWEAAKAAEREAKQAERAAKAAQPGKGAQKAAAMKAERARQAAATPPGGTGAQKAAAMREQRARQQGYSGGSSSGGRGRWSLIALWRSFIAPLQRLWSRAVSKVR